MDRLRQDLIVTFRRLGSSPGFTLAAIVTLALGIGANTTIFSAVNALVLRPLHVERPNELVFLNTRLAKNEFPTQSYPNYLDFRDRNNTLAGLAGYRMAPTSVSRGDGNNGRMWSYEVTGNYFNLLGVNALRGRVFGPDDDKTRGGNPVAVISYACWQRRFGGAPDAVGGKIKINGMDYTVVGVTPRDFTGTELIYTPEIWVPMSMVPQLEQSNWIDERGDQNIFLIGRLNPGVTTPQAEANLNGIANQLGREYPDVNAGMKIVLSPPGMAGTYLRGPIRAFAAILMAVSSLVLLIACVNLASLLLARAADRRKETAIRLALGASRANLVRQLLTESLVLAILGGAAGLLLARWLADLFLAWRPPVDAPVMPQLAIDGRVMLFALAASVITGVLFGLAPALQSARVDLAPALKSEAVADRLRRFALRDLLVTGQVALSVMLVVGSVLMVRSLENALSLHLGFEPRGAAAVAFDLGLQGYDDRRAHDFQTRVIERVRAMPGIQSAGLIDGFPLTLYWNNSGPYIEGKPVPKASDVTMAAMYKASPGYFQAARTRFVEGRDFNQNDKKGSTRVAIVNEAFVRQLLRGEDPIGKRFRFSPTEGEWTQIVGVVEDGKYRSLSEAPMPAIFRPLFQVWQTSTTIVARSTLPEEQVVAMLRRAVLDMDPAISLYQEGSLTDQLGLVLFPARIAAIVLGAFGVLALVLAATGVYGIMAYAVSRRTREIGIRMALGARPGQVIGVVLSHTAILLAAGMAVGLALALTAGRFVSQILYGISPADPLTYAAAIGLMALVAFAACVVPVRRAITVDPVTALRTE